MLSRKWLITIGIVVCLGLVITASALIVSDRVYTRAVICEPGELWCPMDNGLCEIPSNNCVCEPIGPPKDIVLALAIDTRIWNSLDTPHHPDRLLDEYVDNLKNWVNNYHDEDTFRISLIIFDGDIRKNLGLEATREDLVEAIEDYRVNPWLDYEGSRYPATLRDLELALDIAIDELTSPETTMSSSEEREKHIIHFGDGYLAGRDDSCVHCGGHFDPAAVDDVLRHPVDDAIENQIPIHTWDATFEEAPTPYRGDSDFKLLVHISEITGGIYGEGNSNEDFVTYMKQFAPRCQMNYMNPLVVPEGPLEEPRRVCLHGQHLVGDECQEIQYDFGDAPDGLPTGYYSEDNDPSFPTIASIGNFPTLRDNDGARTLNVNEVVLGTSASLERDANDPQDVDGQPNLDFVNEVSNGDSDDGIDRFDLSINPKQWYANIYSPAGGTFYLNVLLDKNFDGTWIQQDLEPVEWIHTNEVIILEPHESVQVELDTNNVENIEYGMWMRVMISDEPVELNWYGIGAFNVGEVEDVFTSSGNGNPGERDPCPPNNPAC